MRWWVNVIFVRYLNRRNIWLPILDGSRSRCPVSRWLKLLSWLESWLWGWRRPSWYLSVDLLIILVFLIVLIVILRIGIKFDFSVPLFFLNNLVYDRLFFHCIHKLILSFDLFFINFNFCLQNLLCSEWKINRLLRFFILFKQNFRRFFFEFIEIILWLCFFTVRSSVIINFHVSHVDLARVFFIDENFGLKKFQTLFLVNCSVNIKVLKEKCKENIFVNYLFEIVGYLSID